MTKRRRWLRYRSFGYRIFKSIGVNAIIIVVVLLLFFFAVSKYGDGGTKFPLAGQNLAVIPQDWGNQGNIVYGTGPQICFLDYSVIRTSGKPSIRLEPHTNLDMNLAREVNGKWYPVKAGDHIVAKCWIKTSALEYTGNNQQKMGARMGVDLYGPRGDNANGLVDGYPHSGAEHIYSMVPWGTTEWTLKEWDFVIPHGVTHIVIWVQCMPPTFPGIGWFADPELYINP